MKNKIILDTNLWIYLLGDQKSEKAIKVKEIINKNFNLIILTTQILGEIFSVLTRKKFKTTSEAQEIIIELISNFPILEIDSIKVIKAMEFNLKYHYTYWDCLLLASAFNENCKILFSEDMQNNQIIENTVRVINPFK